MVVNKLNKLNNNVLVIDKNTTNKAVRQMLDILSYDIAKKHKFLHNKQDKLQVLDIVNGYFGKHIKGYQQLLIINNNWGISNVLSFIIDNGRVIDISINYNLTIDNNNTNVSVFNNINNSTLIDILNDSINVVDTNKQQEYYNLITYYINKYYINNTKQNYINRYTNVYQTYVNYYIMVNSTYLVNINNIDKLVYVTLLQDNLI